MDGSPSRRGYSAPGSPHRPARRHRRGSDVEDSPGTSRGGSPYSPAGRHARYDSSDRREASPRIYVQGPPDEPPAMSMFGRSAPLNRQRSLVRPERRRNDSSDPSYYYRKHAKNLDTRPSATGNDPTIHEEAESGAFDTSSRRYEPLTQPPLDQPLDPMDPTISRKLTKQNSYPAAAKARKQTKTPTQGPSLWLAYCHLVTLWAPDFLLKCFGKPQKAQQRAWREKMGLISIIILICTFVGFLTFGFTAVVCPSSSQERLRINHVGPGYLIIHGKAYDLTRSRHPYAQGIPDGANVLYLSGQPHYGGYDASFMFQNVNGHCKDLITAIPDSGVPVDGDGNLGWYFPCNAFKQDGTSPVNKSSPYYFGYACHLSPNARNAYYNDLVPTSEVYFTWEDVKNSSRNLAVWGSDVFDLDLIDWFNRSQVKFPERFTQIQQDPAVRGVDLTLPFTSTEDKQIAKCFSEIIRVGTIDTATVGCIASKVVLYVSLAFILSIVVCKFVLALAFQWFISHKYAATKGVRSEKQKQKEAEDWTDDIYRPPPRLDANAIGAMSERSSKASSFLPTKSRFSSPYAIDNISSKNKSNPVTMASSSSTTRLVPHAASMGSASEFNLPSYRNDSHTSLLSGEAKGSQRNSATLADLEGPGPAGFIHDAVVPQPPPEYQPFGYPLVHTICLVTAYSEGESGLRSSLDSIATTDYPNSHKLILVICDGLVKGSGEEFTTPEIVLGMMKDHTILPDEVQPYSYVAVTTGSKRHNMAKIYAGFYDYGEHSHIPAEQQQRVPMLVVVKTGTPDEAGMSKPGNRGKRDTQIILMSFLQKVMFDERMTELEYEMFNGIWKITGIAPDYYETLLMVDADTKVFPDSLTHMNSAMVKDPEVMGLCGETKIANKRTSWVTMIQVFEYFISHHQEKSFEAVFGGVTCLPGCFCMYRIKSPKGGQNYWVPILANPDIVEHYSENQVDTLHKKNLLLLGEDRYLSTLMLKTFPKRKQIFVPQAICKTEVPDKFKVLLSQRRRWINSTIHNLMELVLVRDLCGTFCFSMQFVIFIQLVGTLVLPAAICFTVYLIADTIIAGVGSKPIPVIPLILLGLILGLPGLLIVLTAHRVSYVMWMLIYLLSLPIWNGVLPAYAYWKFDDFSWGDTRKTAGEKTQKAGLEYEGEFDSSKITMKKWREFEQERRLRGSTIRPAPSPLYAAKEKTSYITTAPLVDPYSDSAPATPSGKRGSGAAGVGVAVSSPLGTPLGEAPPYSMSGPMQQQQQSQTQSQSQFRRHRQSGSGPRPRRPSEHSRDRASGGGGGGYHQHRGLLD